MPGLIAAPAASTKRKRTADGSKKPRKSPKRDADTETHIIQLEEQIVESQEHYNNIVTLQSLLHEHPEESATLAAVALCRSFCRLISNERLVKRAPDSHGQVVQWLKERLREYVDVLTSWLKDPARANTALTLVMRIVKEETSQDARRSEQAWKGEKSTFVATIRSLLEKTEAEAAREEFVDKYLDKYDDLRFYTMLTVKRYLTSKENHHTEATLHDTLELLSQTENVPVSQDQLSSWYGQPPKPANHQLLSISAHRKVAQGCWLAIFRSPLTPILRKTILDSMSSQILPWFPNRMEVLADFLTDSFNAGGTLSLLALSGIFTLMTEHNLDYPDFYTKPLLDEDVLHSKHRSRFFRHLDQFMSSSHLPAAMVASFIKRLSRLSLQAPPGAIVWIIPWVYNMLRRHPSCTFMLHRPYHPSHSIYATNPDYQEEGMDDPFSTTQTDPMLTNAIDSSLWELHTLQDHWHPNVATLAKILGEQFTKREYVLEDFLDHGYGTLTEAELGKELSGKGKVEVEWEIPKRILTSEGDGGGLNGLGELLRKAIEQGG